MIFKGVSRNSWIQKVSPCCKKCNDSLRMTENQFQSGSQSQGFFVFFRSCQNTSLVLWRKLDKRTNKEWIIWCFNVDFIGKLVVLKLFDWFTVALIIGWNEELAGIGFRTMVAVVAENTSSVVLYLCQRSCERYQNVKCYWRCYAEDFKNNSNHEQGKFRNYMFKGAFSVIILEGVTFAHRFRKF